MTWYIREIPIANRVVAAPLAGISEPVFRALSLSMGAGLVFAEMVSDKAICHQNPKTLTMTKVGKNEHPIAMQLFGSDPQSMREAAIFLDSQTDCDIIDINMGCPMPKVTKTKAGSALMKDVDKAVEIVKAVVEAVKKPVSVKMRAGWDSQSINAVPLAKAFQSAGVSMITIHGRTRAQLYGGKADWSIIRDVVQAVTIPVIGNGDVVDLKTYQGMLKETGCAAVMVGRGLLGNPWLIKSLVQEKDFSPTVTERFDLMKQHIDAQVRAKGEKAAIREMRGHVAWYLKGLPLSNPVKVKVNEAVTQRQMQQILSDYQQQLQNYLSQKPAESGF